MRLLAQHWCSYYRAASWLRSDAPTVQFNACYGGPVETDPVSGNAALPERLDGLVRVRVSRVSKMCVSTEAPAHSDLRV